MDSTPPRDGQADDRPPAYDVGQLRALAELYLIEVCGLPPHLLPSGLEGAPYLAAVELRAMAQRRMRLVQRLHTAAATVASQAVQLIETTAAGQAPPRQEPPLNGRDVATVAELTARLHELDHQLIRWTTTVVKAAAAAGVQPPRPPRAEDCLEVAPAEGDELGACGQDLPCSLHPEISPRLR